MSEEVAQEELSSSSLSSSSTTKSEVRTLVREDIETLILNKIVESINMHSSIGALHTKLLTVELQRDKLLHRVTNLQRQVVDLTKAVRSMSENVGRQNGNDTQAYQPIRFYRSVGLQVAYNNNNVHPTLNMFKEPPSEPNGILKMTNNNLTHHHHHGQHHHGHHQHNHGPPPALLSSINGLKRSSNTLNKPVVSIADVSKQVELEKQNKIRKLSPSASPSPGKDGMIAGSIINSPPKLLRNPATAAITKIINGLPNNNNINNNNATKIVEPRIVDLTDDDVPPKQSPPNNNSTLNTLNNNPAVTTVILVSKGPNNNSNSVTTNSNGQLVMRNLVAAKPQNTDMAATRQMMPAAPRQIMPAASSATGTPLVRPGNSYRAVMPDGVKSFILPPFPPPSITGLPRRCAKDIPPRPELTLQEQKEGIVLSWTLKLGANHADIQTYQIYACQEPQAQTAQTKAASWKRVGDVKALPLPMACTLSQFAEENRYHFIVRAVDVYNRTGAFCEVMAINLKKKLL